MYTYETYWNFPLSSGFFFFFFFFLSCLFILPQTFPECRHQCPTSSIVPCLHHQNTNIHTCHSKLGFFSFYLNSLFFVYSGLELTFFFLKLSPSPYICKGLYPETHGIVDNVFYDPVFRALFIIGNPAANNGSWWDGEPIWNTLTRQVSWCDAGEGDAMHLNTVTRTCVVGNSVRRHLE